MFYLNSCGTCKNVFYLFIYWFLIWIKLYIKIILLLMLLLQYNIINLKCITVVALTTFILPKFYINNIIIIIIIIIIINVTDLILYH